MCVFSETMSLHSRSQASDSKWQTGATNMESAHKQKHVLKDEKTRTRRMHRRDVSNSRECDACAAPFSVVTFVRLPHVQKRGVSRWTVPIHSGCFTNETDQTSSQVWRPAALTTCEERVLMSVVLAEGYGRRPWSYV